MELGHLNLADLRKLSGDVAREIDARSQQEVERARVQIQEIADRVGIPLQQLIVLTKSGVPKKKVDVRYRHPDDASLTWTGRGRTPGWVKSWTEAGRSVDELRPAQ